MSENINFSHMLNNTYEYEYIITPLIIRDMGIIHSLKN